MKKKDDGDRPARCRPGLEPFQNELRQSCGFSNLGLFVIRATDADPNEAAPLQHVEAASGPACPERLFTEPRNFPGRNFLLASRGFAFLELFGGKHFSPDLLRLGRARLAPLLSDLKADGIDEGGQREKALRGGQLSIRRWRGFRAFDCFTLDRFYLVTRQQRARIQRSLRG